MEVPESNHIWIKNEPEDLENEDDNFNDPDDPLYKPEEDDDEEEDEDEENVEEYDGKKNKKDEEEEEAQLTDVPDLLYPKILIENDKPIQLIDKPELDKESTNNEPEDDKDDDLAKVGVLIHCPKCKIILTSNSDLDAHRLVCSAVPFPLEKPPTPLIKYPEFCDPRLANPRSAVRQRIRSKNKPKCQQKAALFEIRDGLFWCTQCSYKTASDAGLRHHRRAHQERLASFKCHLCQYGCNKSRDLERHLRTHTGEKPYRCEICHYACASLSNLKRHTMRHTGELPYACKVCEFRCARSGTLEIHERTHNKQKPYQCRLCSRAFAAASSLKRHEGMHAGVGQLACGQCDYRCGQMHLLKRHMQRHERDKLRSKGGEEGRRKVRGGGQRNRVEVEYEKVLEKESVEKVLETEGEDSVSVGGRRREEEEEEEEEEKET